MVVHTILSVALSALDIFRSFSLALFFPYLAALAVSPMSASRSRFAQAALVLLLALLKLVCYLVVLTYLANATFFANAGQNLYILSAIVYMRQNLEDQMRKDVANVRKSIKDLLLETVVIMKGSSMYTFFGILLQSCDTWKSLSRVCWQEIDAEGLMTIDMWQFPFQALAVLGDSTLEEGNMKWVVREGTVSGPAKT